jgi:arylsulfatase A-like enzyme
MDLSGESQKTLSLYGIGNNSTDNFGRQCLMARRFVEAGVRFIELSHGNWDHHQRLRDQLPDKCNEIDKPIAGLLADLKQRGLLEETLVIWGGEFGRTPDAQNGDGRDHNNKGYTTWMAGGGVRGGFSYGATDEHGGEAVENKCHVHDWHATILHMLGLDHERLTYRYAGRNFRLTDVYGTVIKDVVA